MTEVKRQSKERKNDSVSPLEANLYLDRIDVKRYCLRDTEGRGSEHCPPGEAGTCVDDCPLLGPRQRQAMRAALRAGDYLPSVPSIDAPRPMEPSLLPVNDPGPDALVLVTANNTLTFDVLLAVWSRGVTPAYILAADCLGHTVDMAMVFGEVRPERIARAVSDFSLEAKVSHRCMIVPGLAAPLAADLAKTTGWEIEVGPICAAELPLFLGDRWVF